MASVHIVQLIRIIVQGVCVCVCVERHIAEKWYFSYSIIDHSRVTALCVHLMQIFFFTVAHFVFTFELCAAVFFKMALDY